ncbi:Uncharacterized protein dnm_042030 [Desulfonema magnum]|uniref:Uncharacterized protein n=1 Tax=Desulfonema magnum TaxID=45655 RepID=A0A975BME1_9BACT|nr:Uncharacterized protein dnm_042030 [Desulfonema magnum]
MFRSPNMLNEKNCEKKLMNSIHNQQATIPLLRVKALSEIISPCPFKGGISSISDLLIIFHNNHKMSMRSSASFIF